ncbi:hypothetical protein GQ457_16G008550 [Hibiscus cannabinus]
MLSIFIIFILLVVHIRNMDASSKNDDNGPNGPGASASDGHEGVHFGWSDEIVDEDSYEAHEDSGESDWLGRDQLLSDDDEVNVIGAHFRVVKKKIRNKTVQAADLEPPLNLSFVVENENDARNAEVENEANRNKPAESGVNEKEADGNGENETDGSYENDTEKNEVSSVGLSTGEETDYVGSSNVGSYETDEDGDFVSKKTSKIRIVPKLRLVDMIRLGREELNVELNKQLCSRAKKWAEEKIKGNIIHEFNRLFDYVLALRTADQMGLLEEVQQCLPHVEHRYCARHMYANWKKDHKGGDLQLLFWNCCKATTQPLFRKHVDRICKLKPKAYDDLMEKDHSHWSKAFFSIRSKCDAIDNNFCEAFNSAIIGVRFKSIISMFEDIRHYVMHRLVEHKKKLISWKGEFCPRIAKKLEEHKARSSFCHVLWNGADGYEVQNHANQPPPMATHPGPSSSIPSDPPSLIGPFSPPHSIRQSAPQPSTGPSSPPHSTIPSAPQPSNGPSSPPHSTLPSAPQPSTGPSSPPHSTIPSAPPMVFMPTPSVQPSLAFDSTSPPVTRITTFSPKRKVTANRMPLYRRSREHATPSTTVIPHVSSQPTATVNVPQEGKGRPSKLTIWKP